MVHSHGNDDNTAVDYVAQSIEGFAEDSNTQMVHAIDEHGNEVAVALIIEGPFLNDDQEKAPEDKPLDVQLLSENEFNQVNWVGAQEECVSIPNCEDPNEQIPILVDVKPKKEVIKVYKFDHAMRKTLKRLKIDKKNKNKVVSMKKKMRISGVKNAQMPAEKPNIKQFHRKSRKVISDKMFPMPSSLKGVIVTGQFHFTPIICNGIKREMSCMNKFIFPFLISDRPRSSRPKKVPRKWASYWDMNIPTQFYEEEFLQFEEMQFKTKSALKPLPDVILRKFEIHEKKMKRKGCGAFKAISTVNVGANGNPNIDIKQKLLTPKEVKFGKFVCLEKIV